MSTPSANRPTSRSAWPARTKLSSPSVTDHGVKSVLAVTLGDVRGIGPEIVEKAAAHPQVRDAATLVFVGPAGAGIDADEVTGHWQRAGSVADAGRFAGR